MGAPEFRRGLSVQERDEQTRDNLPTRNPLILAAEESRGERECPPKLMPPKKIMGRVDFVEAHSMCK